MGERLRRLQDLGLVARNGDHDREPAYRLTSAGRDLMPTFLALRAWAANWLPEDPAMIDREPGVLAGRLARRIDPASLPDREVVLEIRARHQAVHRAWLVLRHDAEPYGCVDDPLLDQTRYVYIDAGAPVLLALAVGRLDWAGAIGDGSVVLSGDPGLTKRLPSWFRLAESSPVTSPA